MIDFNLSGMSGVARLGAFRFAVAASAWAHEVEPMVLSAVKRAAPVSKGAQAGRTRGKVHMRDTLRANLRTTPTGASLTVTSTAPQARFVLRGTKPHTIAPRNAKALYWVGPGGGHFARLVHHPGTKANPFADRAVRQLTPLLVRRFEAIVTKTLVG